jgi:hypothetical protein
MTKPHQQRKAPKELIDKLDEIHHTIKFGTFVILCLMWSILFAIACLDS